MVAQLTATNGPRAAGPASWKTRAASSLPVPVSPVRSNVSPAAGGAGDVVPRAPQRRAHHPPAGRVDAGRERPHVAREQEQAAADPDQAPVPARRLAVDARPVEERAVAAAEIAHPPAPPLERDVHVTARRALVVDARGPATDLDASARRARSP